jgi:hypothetical protein
MTCPECRLLNPPSAARCDCGYDFESGLVAESYIPPEQRARDRARETIDARSSAKAFAVACVCAAVIVSLAKLGGPTGLVGVATYVIGALAVAMVAVGLVLLPWRMTRADAGRLLACGLGAWAGVYVALSVLLQRGAR